jgi:hypothetical protein
MKVLDRESIEKIARALGQQKELTEEEVYGILDCEPTWY